MGLRVLRLRVIRLLAAVGAVLLGLTVVTPLLVGWRGPAVDRQAVLSTAVLGAHPSRVEMKLVAASDLPSTQGVPGDYVWVIAASGLLNSFARPRFSAQPCQAGWTEEFMSASPSHPSAPNGVYLAPSIVQANQQVEAYTTAYLTGCVGTWPPGFDVLKDHPSPPSRWPLPVLVPGPSWISAFVNSASVLPIALSLIGLAAVMAIVPGVRAARSRGTRRLGRPT